MCGIAGWVGDRAAREGEEAMVRVRDRMAHRGPDDRGLAVLGPAVLAHRRLSIIDLRPEAGQPMLNEDGTIGLVINGEIYNHRELRVPLEAAGHRFRSQSDSEVVLHLYEEEGDACVERLRGMFSMGIWDGRRGRLLLARDRAGEKPLFWHEGPKGIAFASEVQALLASGLFPPEPDLDAIDAYLALQYVPSPMCAFQGVHKLPPAHRLTWSPGGPARVERYWSLRFDRPVPMGPVEAAARLRERLEEAVRSRMMADVPVGAFLSGGIDSSAVVAMMARLSPHPVRTFSVGFTGRDFSELPWARLVAKRYGCDHHELEVRPDMTAILPELVNHYGEPFADASAVPTWYVSRLAAQHVKVVLSGDGGDEALGGYNRYRWARMARAAGRLTGPLAGIAAAALQRIPVARLQEARDAVRLAALPEVQRYLALIGHIGHEHRLRLYSPDLRRRFAGDATLARFQALHAAATAPDDDGRWLEIDAGTYLPDDIFVKVDIASMAHALETRAPLVDHELMAFSASLPTSLKLGWRQGKRVLRDAVRDLVPAEILDRPKKGFGLPLDRWMREDLASMSRDLLLDRRARDRGLFDPVAVGDLLDRHARGESRGLQIWNLVVLEQWFRTFIDRG